MNHLYQRHCLRLLDFTFNELNNIIELSKKLKKMKQNNQEIQLLKNKNIALIFEKESTRTRCSFEVAAFDQGANVTYLGPGSTHLGTKESTEDTAKVLSRLYDGIQYRGNNHKTIEVLSKYSSIPVWNGLTDRFHPTQLIADLLTINEHFPKKQFCDIKCAYVGDTRNNIGNSILEAASITGLQLYLVAPKKYWPKKDIFLFYQKKAKKQKGNITCTENISKGVKNAHFIYTDVWVSMGESEEFWKERIQLLKDYQINKSIISMTNNPEIKILHCLPALHDNNTKIGKKILKKYGLKDGMEITNDIFKKHEKTIFEQAENKLHTIKAIILSSLSKTIHL